MKNKRGQALIVLIAFSLIAITVIGSVVLISIASNSSVGKTQEGAIALDIADSGAENALLRLLRDPSYTGETLAVGTGTAVVTVTGTNPHTIISTGTSGSFKRVIQVVASDSAGILTVTSWKEQ